MTGQRAASAEPATQKTRKAKNQKRLTVSCREGSVEQYQQPNRQRKPASRNLQKSCTPIHRVSLEPIAADLPARGQKNVFSLTAIA
jgi:hypothetical protein